MSVRSVSSHVLTSLSSGNNRRASFHSHISAFCVPKNNTSWLWKWFCSFYFSTFTKNVFVNGECLIWFGPPRFTVATASWSFSFAHSQVEDCPGIITFISLCQMAHLARVCTSWLSKRFSSFYFITFTKNVFINWEFLLWFSLPKRACVGHLGSSLPLHPEVS